MFVLVEKPCVNQPELAHLKKKKKEKKKSLVFQAVPRLHVIEGNPKLLPLPPKCQEGVLFAFIVFVWFFETGSHVTKVGIELVQG